jgi:hypothetical protein
MGNDLRHVYLPASEDILQGRSPYPSPDAVDSTGFAGYYYPPTLAVLLTPLTLLSGATLGVLSTLVFVALVPAILLTVGVRDWRCVSLALLWAPTAHAVGNANLSLPLTLGVAVAWRWRGADARLGVVLGASAAVKVFLWPLLLWPLAMRRIRSFVVSVLVVGAVSIVSWTIIRFEGLASFPALLNRLSELGRSASYSTQAVLYALGASSALSTVIVGLLAAAMFGAALHFGRLGDERRLLTALLAAALVLTPIVWQHYLTLLLVPLALARPRLSAAWFLPLLAWVCPMAPAERPLWQTLLVPGVAVCLLAVCLRSTPAAQRQDVRPGALAQVPAA